MLCYYNQADSSDSDEESSSDEKDTNTGGFKVVRAAFDADKKDMNKFQSVSRKKLLWIAADPATRYKIKETKSYKSKVYSAIDL